MKLYSFIGIVVLVLVIFQTGCIPENADRLDRLQTDNQQEVYQIKQPLPFFDYSYERSMVIQLYKARNQAITTWSIWRSDYGMIEDWCPSISFGIPYDTQLTNPLKPYYHNGSSAAVEQAEVNGLFSSKNTAATWVMCLDEETGEVSPVYVESKVTVYAKPIRVEDKDGDGIMDTVVRLERPSSVNIIVGQ